MEKKLIAKIVVLLAVVIIYSLVVGVIYPPIVKKAYLRTAENVSSGGVELNYVETYIALCLHNLGIWTGEVTADPTFDDLTLQLYCWNDKRISIAGHGKLNFNVDYWPFEKSSFSTHNPLLTWYIELLAKIHSEPVK